MKTLDLQTPLATLQAFLTALNWLQDENIQKVESPGEGNMNVLMRVVTDKRTFILKQSRAYVRKYPDVAAPIERIDAEHEFYLAIRGANIEAHTPRVLAYAPAHYLMMMEDLGAGEDMTQIYSECDVAVEDVTCLLTILAHIHKQKVPDDFPLNLALRKLNHAHLFVLPYMLDNGFQLDDVQQGLQALSMPYKTDKTLYAIIDKLGQHYLSQGTTLLHGDYYPGSWMKAKGQLYIMDPEFCFVGAKEYDVGVMAAHLIMTTGEHTWLNTVCATYANKLDEQLVYQYAGMEILRRLIGLAQLPLKRTIEEKAALLKLARELVMA